MKPKVALIALLSVVIYSCATKSTTTATTKPTETVKPNPVAFAEGKNLYENNCAKCHKLFSPSERTKAEWKPILVSMQKKAKLDDMQMASISDYINSQL